MRRVTALKVRQSSAMKGATGKHSLSWCRKSPHDWYPIPRFDCSREHSMAWPLSIHPAMFGGFYPRHRHQSEGIPEAVPEPGSHPVGDELGPEDETDRRETPVQRRILLQPVFPAFERLTTPALPQHVPAATRVRQKLKNPAESCTFRTPWIPVGLRLGFRLSRKEPISFIRLAKASGTIWRSSSRLYPGALPGMDFR